MMRVNEAYGVFERVQRRHFSQLNASIHIRWSSAQRIYTCAVVGTGTSLRLLVFKGGDPSDLRPSVRQQRHAERFFLLINDF